MAKKKAVKPKKAKVAVGQSEYINGGGGICPICEGDQIEGQGVEINGDHASQEVSCLDCQAHWTDFYGLKGYDFLTDGDGNEE